ncbi:MAG: penicillin-binding transpeptidase domain-containing protein, partial [Ignavibacteriaceae bacterium]|nr:penicillin-binding transpeptidase domain-containing protein [Ignavibacteriaceae bacterium]
LNYVVRAKTGWGEQDDANIGWYVGYVEIDDNAYYFANCIQSAISENKDFARARIEIVYKIFNELNLIEK